MNLKSTIQADMKEALRQKDDARLSTLRMLLAALSNKEIELGKKNEGLSDEVALAVVRSEAKKRSDAIEQFTKGQRLELAHLESCELEILKSYLPAELSDSELEDLVREAIVASGVTDLKDFGKAMKEVMVRVSGRASGDRASVLVRKLLS